MNVPLRGYLILLGAQLATGAAAVFARYALHSCGPVSASALRLSIGALLIWLYLQITKANQKIDGKHEIILVFAGVGLAFHFALWITSLLYTTVAVSTLLVSTSPAFTALYDAVALKKPRAWGFWLALLVAVAGVGLITSNMSASVPVAGKVLLGNSLAIAGGAALSVYLLLVRDLINKYRTLTIVARSYAWAAVSLVCAALVMRQKFPGDDLTSWGGIIAMALISQVLGHTGINASLRWFSSSTVAFSTLLEPVLAAFLACLCFAEFLSLAQIAGCLIVLGCLAAILSAEKPDALSAATPDL